MNSTDAPAIANGWYLMPDGTVTLGRGLDLPVLTLTWKTGPAGATTTVETYGHHPTRTATIRVTDPAGTIRTGTLTAGGTENVLVIWTGAARSQHGAAWLKTQADEVTRRLARLWGTT